MPQASGWTVAEACQARFNVPVALITGWGDTLEPGLVEKYGVRFVLAKPFRLPDVLEQVAACLRRP
jgi:FixJ family two-component response regulator